MTALNLGVQDQGDEYTVPAEYALQKVAILATTGAGKSNTAVVLAEELHAAGVPFVAVDPKGDWWGIRSSADGDHDGLPIPVFGGEHGDLPLEPTAGKLIARLIAEKRLSCVIDVSDFDTRAAMFRFLTDFASTLLRVNKHPLHVFAEECDDYLPQRTGGEGGDLAKCLGAWQRLVKRGRNKGLGVTMISQRSASVNKDALNMAQTLIAMRVTAPRDREAIREWVRGQGGTEDLVDSLPGLDHGEAWVWSPQWLRVIDRVRFRRRWTFDSGAAPELGGAPVEPTTVADVDLQALGAEIAETVEKAKAEDPVELHKRIRELERALRDVKKAKPAEAERVEVPIVPAGLAEDLARLRREITMGADERLSELEALHRSQTMARQTLLDEIDKAQARIADVDTAPRPITTAQRVADVVRTPAPRQRARVEVPVDMDAPLKAGARRMLAAIAQWPNGLTKRQCSTIAKVKYGGTFSDYLRSLTNAGLVTASGDLLLATDAGRDLAGIEEVPEDPQAVLEYWRPRFKAGARRMLDIVIAQGDDGIDRRMLSAHAAVAYGGTFSDYLRDLVRAGLVVEHNGVVYLEEWLR